MTDSRAREDVVSIGGHTGSLAVTANTGALGAHTGSWALTANSVPSSELGQHDTSQSYTTSSERLGNSRLGVNPMTPNTTSPLVCPSTRRLSIPKHRLSHTVNWKCDQQVDTEDMTEPIRTTDLMPLQNSQNDKQSRASNSHKQVSPTANHHGSGEGLGSRIQRNATRKDHTSSSLSKGMDSVSNQERSALAKANEKHSQMRVETRSITHARRNEHTCSSLCKGTDSVLNQDKCQSRSLQDETRTLSET